MKGKSLATAIITMAVALLAAYSGMVSATAALWFGSISMLLTMLLNSPIFSSGSWPVGWNWVMWANNIGGLLIMWLGSMAETPIIPATTVTIIIATINAFLTGFVKQYQGDGGQSILGDK